MITSGGTTTLGLYDFKIGIEQFGQTGYWVQKANGYPINKRIMLTNGDIVKSTIDTNLNNPNNNMTGWLYELEPNVRSTGAKGNGTNSDVTAILNAQTKYDQLTFTDGTYLVDSNLTISVPVSFTKKAKLKVTNGAKVYFDKGTCDEVCAHWFSGNTAIQDAVYAAKSVKAVFIRSGVWLLDNPVLIPTTSEYWGVNIRGACDAQEYGNLASSRATILRANAPMNVVLGNRETWKDKSGYYNKISNLVIEANNIANYGYINGYQDTVTGVNVTGALIGGIIFGNWSNSSSLFNVSATRNQRGLILTGSPPIDSSTHAVISNCRLRQNFRSGVTICQATGVRFVDSVIEANAVVGIEMLNNNTSDDFYAGSAAYISYIMFERIGLEDNARTIDIDGTSIPNIPSVIEFKMCNLVGQTTDPASPVSDIKLQNTRGIIFDRNNTIKVGMEVGSSAVAIQVKGYQALDTNFPTVFGVNSSNVQITKITDAGDQIEDHLLYSQYAAQMKTYTTSATLTKNDVFGSVITNGGQGAVDLTLTLPTTGLTTSPRYSPSFTFVVATQQLANKLTFQTQAGAYIIYQGAQRTKIDTASNGIIFGTALKFTLIVIGGVQNWLVDNIHGSWNAS